MTILYVNFCVRSELKILAYNISEKYSGLEKYFWTVKRCMFYIFGARDILFFECYRHIGSTSVKLFQSWKYPNARPWLLYWKGEGVAKTCPKRLSIRSHKCLRFLVRPFSDTFYDHFSLLKKWKFELFESIRIPKLSFR